MNIQHSSRTDAWGTPEEILAKAREVLGDIDLDPASEDFFNASVGAKMFYTRENNGLGLKWCGSRSITVRGVEVIPATCFVNPPGGKTKNKSNTVLFWDKLIYEVSVGHIKHAIFMGFSLECLQTTQQCHKPMLSFPFCVPSRRIKFVAKNGTFSAPSHSNVIVYVPGTIDRTDKFIQVFSGLGICKV